MKILLDTHTFLWWSLDPEKLPKKLIKTLSSQTNTVFFSTVSSWESQIKVGIGKLVLKEKLSTIIDKEIKQNDWNILPIHLHHTIYLEKLPPLHNDPFDRILIAQALSEGLTIATKDSLILSYRGVKTIWD